MAQRHHDRAEALDYEPSKVHGPNARQNGVEATHEPERSSGSHRGDEVDELNPLLTSGATRFTTVETDGPLTFVLSPESVERKSERALPPKVSLFSLVAGGGRGRDNLSRSSLPVD
jgi:hypothetical protein